MSIVRKLPPPRPSLCLGLLGPLALAAGCGRETNKNNLPPAPATTQSQLTAESDARQRAFGKATIPTKAAKGSTGSK